MGELTGKKIPKWMEREGERERERALTQSKLERCPAEAELMGRGGR